MRIARIRWAGVVGTTVLCCAVLLTTVAGAQVQPDSAAQRAARDSAARDSAAARVVQDSLRAIRNAAAQARIDSIVRVKAADTIKAPIAHFEKPDTPELTERLRFSRNDILSSGAINLADILDRVPGVTTFRTRWMAGMHTAAYNSDFRRIRVFYDGVERDAIDARNDGVLDLDDIPIWTLDEIIIERVPGEVRVWLRGLTVRRTTPFTRVDIFTGDLNTNGFRGVFAKRFGNGVTLQFIGQQLATQSGRISLFGSTASNGTGDGDLKFVDTRLGWARGKLTIDAVGTGIARQRDPHTAREGYTDLPAYKGARREAYVRIAYGDSTRGLFSQGLVGVLRTRLEGIKAAVIVDSTLSADTVRARTQQILTIGYRADRWHASIVDRARPVEGTLYHAPAVRAGFGGARYQLMAYAEQRSLDSLREVDISGTARPRPWLSLVASHSTRSPRQNADWTATSATRAEGAVRFRRLWLGGGVIQQGATEFANPVMFGAPAAFLPTPATTGLLATVHGNLYKDVRLDMQLVRWSEAQYTQPRMSVRTELALVSDWRARFPKGEFSINARVIHDLRNAVPFYWSTGTEATTRVTEPAQVVTGLLELRIQSATLFYQYRNMTNRRYEQIPGITMPPAVQMYGVRWEFWN